MPREVTEVEDSETEQHVNTKFKQGWGRCREEILAIAVEQAELRCVVKPRTPGNRLEDHPRADVDQRRVECIYAQHECRT